MQIAPYLIPKQHSLSKPVLRHPDLSPNNILITDDLTISGVIDWQHASILPAFVATTIPNSIQNYSDDESLHFKRLELPQDFAELGKTHQQTELERYRRRHLHYLYLGYTRQYNPLHWDALQEPSHMLRRRLFMLAGEPWEGNNIPLKAMLIHLARNWQAATSNSSLQTTACPISFDEQEADEALRIMALQEEMDAQMEMVRGIIGINEDGWASYERAEFAIAQARKIKEVGLEELNDHERMMTNLHWPFDDHDED